MATEQTIAAALGRLWVNYRATPSEEDAVVVLEDWVRALTPYRDASVTRAAEQWLRDEEWMPTLAGFMSATQAEERLARAQQTRALPSGPRNDEPLADSHEHAEMIRSLTGLLPRFERSHNAGAPMGHDHHRGAAHCPVCSQHDHSDEHWRVTCPACGTHDEIEPEPLWSSCSECDGSHFVFVNANDVRPCSTCNRSTYDLWVGGHMAAGHRCEVCAPSRRRREIVEA